MATGSGDLTASPPRWQLDSVYTGFESDDFRDTRASLSRAIDDLAAHCAAQPARGEREWLREALRLVNEISALHENLESYCYCRYSVETDDETASAALNANSDFAVPMNEAHVAFRNALARLTTPLDELTAEEPGYRYILTEELEMQRHQMGVAEESLAADLNRAGGDAWSRLQSTISSQLSMAWDDKTGETKTVVELRSLATHPDRETRRKAYHLELEAWKSVEVPLAFALNGVKGFTDVVNRRRGWESTLARSQRQSRVAPQTLESLIGSMESSLPVFHRYLRAKARLLGVERLAFYDLFAPVAGSDGEWTFAEARTYITRQLSAFSPEMGAFVERVFASGWIDAEPRPGKVGGAYCIDMPVAGETRILANFDGSFDGVSTLAHELGHAYHADVLRNLPPIQRQYPMTLAETASLFSETLVFSARAAEAGDDPAARVAVLEPFLQGAAQVVVDILSRYRFEQRVMDRRRDAELSPREFSDLMLQAQTETYGDALNADERHPYMWAVKGHYYRVDLSFYNFPYAFGLLFGLVLYAAYRQKPEGFPERYRALLGETGRAAAETVAKSAGFDITGRDFWDGAITQIETMVTEFEETVERLL